MAGLFGVRRFAARGSRPDCFEVYVKATGDCCSFGAFRYQAEQLAREYNSEPNETQRERIIGAARLAAKQRGASQS